MTNTYHSIYSGEIFDKSRCIWHENTTLDFLRSQLISLGYHSTGGTNKVWRRGDRQVVVCLVDDFSTCSSEFSTTSLFDKNTIVITDNWVGCPTRYKLLQLPSSFFGIYSYDTDHNEWNPQRRFNFSVNRIDSKRLLVFLELIQRYPVSDEDSLDSLFRSLDLINFNCWSWDGDNNTLAGLKDNFSREFEKLNDAQRSNYRETLDSLLPLIPFRNHGVDLDLAHVSSWLNVVVETYNSSTNNIIAISEKTFRALTMPTPWMLYSGKNTVAYLESLGFDVMSDIIEHSYDDLTETGTTKFGDKSVDFVFKATGAVDYLKSLPWDQLQQRAASAANHNRDLLKQMRSAWPTDFAAWWANTINYLK